MSELENFVASNFGIATPNEIEAITSLFEFSKVKKGEKLLESGDSCKEMVFIQSGYLRMFNLTDGNEVTQWISSKGTFASDLSSFYFDTPSRWTIQALVDSELYTISKIDYDKILEFVPKWGEIEKLFLVNCFTTMENRIYSHLSMSSKERYDFLFENNRELFNQVPLQFIASMLGMTPETMSRIRKNLSK